MKKTDPPSKEPILTIPYPQRLWNNKLDHHYAKVLEVFKKLHINIPFAKALEQMSNYVKFMKEILTNKRKLGDYETVAILEECSNINYPMLQDSESFTIPCSIRNAMFEKALCDLGDNINLMPLTIFRKLGLG